MHQPDSYWTDRAADSWDDHNIELARLIARCRSGDVRAFEELYATTVRWMLARIRRMVDDGQAEDVLAEVYLQIWKSLDGYDEQRARPVSWLAMIARSRALDHLRREKRRRGDEPPAGDAGDVASDDSPEQLLSRSQDARLVHLSLATLNDDERLVLGLAYFQDCTQPQISSMTGMPLGTVKSLVFRAQQKLRKCFQRVTTSASPMGVRTAGSEASA